LFSDDNLMARGVEGASAWPGRKISRDAGGAADRPRLAWRLTKGLMRVSLHISGGMAMAETANATLTGAIYPDLEGRTVLVTGGGSGIGASIVRAFARQKAKVGFLDIADEASRALVAELSGQGQAVHFEHCDLTDIDAVRRAIEAVRDKFGPIGILVNNAANDQRHKTEEVTPDYFDHAIAVNLKHQFFCAQAVLSDMQAAGKGAIINFGSVSWMIGQGGMALYTACKSAVLGLTRSLARDFGSYNIRVNAIAPGWIMTERQKTLWLTPEGEQELMQRQCLKRHLQPEDIARFTVFLASDDASACTNQQYVVDGGWV
jgi:NAD(P)-dependent dehydrogenase (short-subunit alcohol dehydrogenase family)